MKNFLFIIFFSGILTFGAVAQTERTDAQSIFKKMYMTLLNADYLEMEHFKVQAKNRYLGDNLVVDFSEKLNNTFFLRWPDIFSFSAEGKIQYFPKEIRINAHTGGPDGDPDRCFYSNVDMRLPNVGNGTVIFPIESNTFRTRLIDLFCKNGLYHTLLRTAFIGHKNLDSVTPQPEDWEVDNFVRLDDQVIDGQEAYCIEFDVFRVNLDGRIHYSNNSLWIKKGNFVPLKMKADWQSPFTGSRGLVIWENYYFITDHLLNN